MTLIAHIADIHLGYRQYGLVEREEDIYEAFNEAIDKIIEEHAKIVLISGDFFNSPRPPIRALYHTKLSLEKLRSQGIKVFCILGDHDLPRRIGEYSPIVLFKDNFLQYINGRTEVIDMGGQYITISGIDRVPSTMSDNARELIEKISKEVLSRSGRHIFMAHLPLLSISGELCIDDLPEGYDYYALGHEHIRKITPKGGGIVAYPGSIEILSRDEIEIWKAEGKGFYLVDLSGSEPIVHKANLDCIRLQEIFEISLKDSAAISKIFDSIVDHRKKPIVHLIIKDQEFDLKHVHELVDKLRLQGCLEVRYRKKGSERFEMFRSLSQVELSRLNIEELINQVASDIGLSKEELELALQIYNEFRTGGEEALRELIRMKSSDVKQIDTQGA